MNGEWRVNRERGSKNALRLIIWLALHCGRKVCRFLLLPISAYFLLTAPVARRSSQVFLRRALNREPGWRHTFFHLFTFATTLLDRVYLMHGRECELAIDIHNEQVLLQALAAGRGCLLFGSHLGSFEMLSIVGSGKRALQVNVVMHLDDSAHVRSLLMGSSGGPPYRVIPLGEPGSMMRAKECLERGEIVGILADRVYGNERTRSVPFLGQPARFSLSPLRLARITGAPVVIVFGLFRGGCRYDIVFESLTSGIAGCPAEAEETMTQCLIRYVEVLERHALLAPYNWFNFYDYWSAHA